MPATATLLPMPHLRKAPPASRFARSACRVRSEPERRSSGAAPPVLRLGQSTHPGGQGAPDRLFRPAAGHHANMTGRRLMRDGAWDQAGQRTRRSRWTIRSRPAMATQVGQRRTVGSTGRPATSQAPFAGALAPYHSSRQVRATGAARGTPSFSQSSRATNRRARSLSGSRSRKRDTSRPRSKGPAGQTPPAAGPPAAFRFAPEAARASATIPPPCAPGPDRRRGNPRGSQQREAADQLRAALCQRDGERAAHAVARQYHRPAQ